ncbi:hypothetical protein O3M35_005729 [Rhynocoris fuscipes]|uniref:Cadherin domain-containing protein n=1 Tax=Rhynocoris fuscipes TaxID=488301 RepID=A0AAW1DJB0_9HEMI
MVQYYRYKFKLIPFYYFTLLFTSCINNFLRFPAGDSDHQFTIGRDQGNVQLGKRLDRESRSFYNLTLSATDGVHTAYTNVNIYFNILQFSVNKTLYS